MQRLTHLLRKQPRLVLFTQRTASKDDSSGGPCPIAHPCSHARPETLIHIPLCHDTTGPQGQESSCRIRQWAWLCLAMQLHFADNSKEQPLEIYHKLKLSDEADLYTPSTKQTITMSVSCHAAALCGRQPGAASGDLPQAEAV